MKKFIRYEYPIKDEVGNTIIGSFTLKEDAKHPEVVKELKAHEVERFIA